jgi:tetratricopeptide (TPR) repeat protein
MFLQHVASAMEPGLVCDTKADYALGLEDYSAAIRLHKEVLKRDPGNALAHYHLGFALGMENDAAGELREYLRAQQLGLQQWDFFLNFGIARLEQHQFTDAIKILTRATEMAPGHAETHFNLGLAYERAGLLQRARDEISASLKLDPDQRDAENELAVVYAEMSDSGAAQAIWARLLQSDPSDPAALANLATLRAISAQESFAGTLARSL